MSLKDRMERAGVRAEDLDPDADVDRGPVRNAAVPGRVRGTSPRPDTAKPRPLVDLKLRAQNSLFVRLGHRLYDSGMGDGEIRELVKAELQTILQDEELPLNEEQHEQLIEEIVSNTLGYGPIEVFLADDSVTEIMVLGDSPIFVERDGRLQRTGAMFVSEEHLRRTIERIVSQVGRRIDESSPMVDARMLDGSRINAVIPPLAVDGSMLTVRKFARTPFGIDDLIRFGTVSPDIVQFLKAAVEARITILISGGTGTGKTTLLNVLSGFVGDDERIVSIEDSVELQLRQQHVARLESRPPNIEGRGAVTIRDLVRNALRMRPDRIIVGEVRGGEALDMLQAMNTGHEGSLTTLHANAPRDALARAETMVLMAGMDLPHRAIREQIASAIQLVVQISRLSDGSRRITQVCEVTGMESETIQLSDLFTFDWDAGRDPSGRFRGTVVPTGIRPSFESHMNDLGVELPADIFGDPATRPAAGTAIRRQPPMKLQRLVAALLAIAAVFAVFNAQAVSAQVEELDIVDVVIDDRDITLTVVAPDDLRGDEVTSSSFPVRMGDTTILPGVEPILGDELDVVLLIDVSGSMTPQALAAAKASATALIQELPTSARVAVVTFGDDASVIQPFTTDLQLATDRINGLGAGGETALYAGVVEAANLFTPGDDSSRTVVLLSDGGNTVDESSLLLAQAGLSSSDATLHAISIETEEANPAELDALAQASGGSVSRVGELDEIQDLYTALGADIRNQYRLRFTAEGSGLTQAIIDARSADETTLAQGLVTLGLPIVATVPEPQPAPAVPAPAPTAIPAPREASAPAVVTLEAEPNRLLKWASIAAVGTAIAVSLLLLMAPRSGRQARVKPIQRFNPRENCRRGRLGN